MSDLSETRTLWLEREVERLRAENNAMRGYLASMPCPYECDGGLVSVPSSTLNGEYRDEEIDCPHCTKLKELGVNDE